jgi:4-amino-4-deoxy-L-arabinose transferase-like glycosyltransferase
MAPSYPPGLPLQMAAAGWLGGSRNAHFLVVPVNAIACLLLVYVLGRELALPRILALAGCLLLAFSPTFVFMAGQTMSDVPATAWSIAAISAALAARRRVGWSAVAGVAFGMAVLVRPMCALLLPAVLLALPTRPRAWLLLAVGGAPFAVFLLAYNVSAFGSPGRTGYGGLLKGALAWGNFPDRFRHYSYWIVRLLSPVVLVGWAALSLDRAVPVRDRAVLLAWFGAIFLFYCFYVSYDAWWYTRFLLPGFPPLILGAVITVRDGFGLGANGAASWRAVRYAFAALVLATPLVFEIRFDDEERVHKNYKGERVYPQACEMARRRLPPNAIVASMQMSGALHYYTPITYAMWNWLSPEKFAELRARTESRGHKWYALLAPFEVPEISKNLPGDWQEIDRTGDVVLWELPPAVR